MATNASDLATPDARAEADRSRGGYEGRAEHANASSEGGACDADLGAPGAARRASEMTGRHDRVAQRLQGGACDADLSAPGSPRRASEMTGRHGRLARTALRRRDAAGPLGLAALELALELRDVRRELALLAMDALVESR